MKRFWSTIKQRFSTLKQNKKQWKKVVSISLISIVLLSILVPIAVSVLTGFDRFVNQYSKNITTYSISATLHDDMTLTADQTVEYKNNNDVVFKELYFHLYPNSFSATAVNKPVSTLYEAKAYPNGKSYGGIVFSSVTVNNQSAVYSIEGEDNHMLKVVLSEDFYPNDWVKLDFSYTVTLPNVNHRFGYGNNAINLGNFYPIASVFENGAFDMDAYHSNGDPFYSTLANYNINLSYSSDLVLANSGSLQSSQTENIVTTSCVQARAVRDFALVLSKEFEVLTQQVGNTKILYYYYMDETPQTSLQTAVDSLTTFNTLFGTYPYRTLSVVETNFIFGGMEYPNLVMISDNLELYEDYTNTIVHEIAHQWWYGLVGNDEFAYGWLDEGLAEYSTVLFYEQNPSYQKDTDTIITNARNSYILFVDVYSDVFGSVDTSMNRSLNEYTTEPEYVYIAYVKGLLLYDSLREVIGSNIFLSCLKSYYAANRGGIVTPDTLVAAFEKTCYINLETFFDSWINGTVVISSIPNP